jgi:hypothetical protein
MSHWSAVQNARTPRHQAARRASAPEARTGCGASAPEQGAGCGARAPETAAARHASRSRYVPETQREDHTPRTKPRSRQPVKLQAGRAGRRPRVRRRQRVDARVSRAPFATIDRLANAERFPLFSARNRTVPFGVRRVGTERASAAPDSGARSWLGRNALALTSVAGRPFDYWALRLLGPSITGPLDQSPAATCRQPGPC